MSKGNATRTPLIDVNMVGFILSQFWVGMDQPNSLTSDVLLEEAKWAMLFEVTLTEPTVVQFTKPLEDITQHLKPLSSRPTSMVD